MTFLLQLADERSAVWAATFKQLAPELPFRIWPDVGDPSEVRYFASWRPSADVTERFPNLEVLFSTGAGVDKFPLAQLPADLAVVRLVEPGITSGMVEYVSMMALALHRDLFDYLGDRESRRWVQRRVWPAAHRTIGVLGLGVLGKAVAVALAGLGFNVIGWSRRPHEVGLLETHSGKAALPGFLGRCDYLVCLLPLTAETQGFLGIEVLRQLPRGAALINVSRGAIVDHAALKAVLDDGHLSRAVLDVAEVEPLPADHWLWQSDRVEITPHIASMTQPDTAARAVLDEINRHRSGAPMLGRVDRERGY